MTENAPALNERTIEDLLTYTTEELLQFSPAAVNELLDRAIHDQEEILKKVPKKKTEAQVVDLRNKGAANKAKKAALETRDMLAKLPPEFAALMADVQKTMADAQKVVEQQQNKPK